MNLNNNNNSKELDENKKLSNSIRVGLYKKRESLMSQRGKELLKQKKPGSERNPGKSKKKINININQNININANSISGFENHIESNTINNDIISRQSEQKLKGMKMRSFVCDKEKRKDKNLSDKKLYYSGHISIDRVRSRNNDSSIKMDKSFLKQTKIETRDTKEDQFVEFYINDNKKNLEYHLKDNNITTSKYNFLTFLPKGLFYQFSRLSNVYFLFTAIIQSIPVISPLTSLTAIVPLIFVLGVSMIREIIEDLSRHNYDNINNEEEVIVLRENKFVKAMSKSLRHGEIIILYENKSIPADMILIDSCFSEGTCYVETSSLDGEKTLKLKISNKYTQGFISNDIKSNKNIEKFIQNGNYYFGGYIKINTPNSDLNYINGTCHAIFKKNGNQVNQEIAISTNEFLLKGSVLKNTSWIIGIVAYTGMNNKIILNSKKPRLKMSKVEKKLNYYLVFIFIFLMACCIMCSIYHHFFYYKYQKFYDNYIFMDSDPNTESFIIFFTYFLLLNTMIPISLIVSTEIIKMIQGIFMSWDIFLYSKWRHCFCSAKAVSIIEELGNVNFIFSDKTGTLTKNQLQFKYCIIDNKIYEYLKVSEVLMKKNSILSLRKNNKKKSKFGMIDNSANRKNENFSNKNQNLGNNSKVLLNGQEDSSFIADEDNNSKSINMESKSVTIFHNKRISENIIQLKKMNSNNKENGNSISNITNFVNAHKESNKIFNVSNNFNKSENNNSHSNSKNKSINNFSIVKRIKNRKIHTEHISYYSEENEESDNDNDNENESKDGSAINSNDKSNKEINLLGDVNKYKETLEEPIKKEGNSTIMEVKNEDHESLSSFNQIIKFGEGFFTNPDNNPFLRRKSSEVNDEDFDYVHEFWKALSLTNECMIKDDKGQIRYMGTSPDDLELVKIASLQGYKLVETSINTKTIRVLGKDYSFEILKVIGFSSERKRMSIIVKDQLGIKLYIKGADCEISKRLSRKSLENDNYNIISNGLIEFSKRGFRTLMIGFRKINEEDYNFWVNRLHEDELNNQHKQRAIDKLYDIIETNLILLGGTVVEDKLQDKVPETIKEIRSAGIKVWVLTGDKLDTAESIGWSCNLLTKEQKLFTLKVMPGDDERIVKEDPYPEMIQFFTEFQEFIENLVKKYNLETKYSKISKYRSDLNKSPSNNDNSINDYYNSDNVSDFTNPEFKSSYRSDSSEESKIIDLETFKYLRDKKILEPFSIIVESPILCGLFKDEEWTETFLNIAYNSNTVICCRVSPSQKSQVIQKMKNFDRSAVTLAIGDGGNDVSMIMEANIGIGIFGEEGMSAAQASDFSIGEFQLLKRLLFFHGRNNLYRISKMILYFFFKNFAFTMVQLYYSFICLSSGQTFVDDWYITCYNLIFTALPLCVSALSDSDVDIKEEKEKKNLAILYKENRDKYKIFTFRIFLWKLFKGIIYSLIIFMFCFVNEILASGRNKNMWYLSLKTYTCVLIVVSMNLLINNNYIVYFLPLSIGITTFFLFGIFLIINHFGFFFYFNSKASIKLTYSSILTYLHIIIICTFSFLFDYTNKLINIYFSRSLSSRLLLKKSGKSDRKLSHEINKLVNSKSYKKISKKRPNKRNSLNFDDKSKNLLVFKSSSKINKINAKNNTPKAFNNSKYKVGPDYKNEFFSLRLVKLKDSEDKSNKKILNQNESNT